MKQLDRYPEIEKNCGDLKNDHPLMLCALEDNTKFLQYFENLLKNLKSVKGFKSKIKKIKEDSQNFRSYLSELKVAEYFKNFDVEFTHTKKEEKIPDLKIRYNGKEIYLEVKLSADTRYEPEVFREIEKIPSPFFVKIEYDYNYLLEAIGVEKEIIGKLIDFTKGKIKKGNYGIFPLTLGNIKFADVEIKNKKEYGIILKEGEKTYLMMMPKEARKIPFEPIRRRINSVFYENIDQLTNDVPTILVLDIDRREIFMEEIELILYGTDECDPSFLLKLLSPKIKKAYVRDMNVFHEYNLLPTLTYRERNGLFWRDDANILNGVLVFMRNEKKIFVNPFVNDELYVSNLKQLVK